MHRSWQANCITHLSHVKKLLSKFPESAIYFILFTDEKVFTVAPPVNFQNDRVYAPCGTKKRDIAADRLLRTRPTFSKSVVVSAPVSNLGCTELIFVEPGVKVDGAYHRDVLLLHQMLPAIRHLTGDVFVFQQNSAPAPIVHVPLSNICARLHLNSYHLTYGRLTALTLTRSIIRFGAVFRNACTRSP